MFYPQLVAGPIERPQNVLPQMHEKKYFSYSNAVEGLRLIMWGMFKKVVIADRLASATDTVFNVNGGKGTLTWKALTGFFFGATAFDSLSFFADAGTITGSYKVYGIANS